MHFRSSYPSSFRCRKKGMSIWQETEGKLGRRRRSGVRQPTPCQIFSFQCILRCAFQVGAEQKAHPDGRTVYYLINIKPEDGLFGLSSGRIIA